jgi:putative transposase
MPDHLHALILFAPDSSMKQTMSNFNEITAKRAEINWQRDFFYHRLREQNALQLKGNYIRQNPVRAGLVTTPNDWPYIWAPR